MNINKKSMIKYANEIGRSQNSKWKAIAFDSEIANGHSCSSAWPNFIYFSDGADSYPYEVIRRGKQEIYNKTGIRAKTLIIGQDVYEILRFHPDTSEIREWEEYTKEVLKLIQTGIGDPPSLSPYRIQLLADFFGLDQIIVDDDFGKDMLLCCESENVSGLLFKDTIC